MGLPRWDCTVKALLPAVGVLRWDCTENALLLTVGVLLVEIIPGVDPLAKFATLSEVRFPVS